MGGRGPRFSSGNEVLDSLAAQAVVLEDRKGYRTIWISIDMIGMTWQMTSRLRMEPSAMTSIPFAAIVVNFSFHTRIADRCLVLKDMQQLWRNQQP